MEAYSFYHTNNVHINSKQNAAKSAITLYLRGGLTDYATKSEKLSVQDLQKKENY